MDFNVALKSDFNAPEIPTVPEIMGALDVDAARLSFAPYKAKIDTMLGIAQEYNVSNAESNADAVAKISDAKKLTKILETERKRIVEEPNQFVKKINNFAKGFTAPLKEIERVLKNKVGQYQSRLELERREQEKKAREASAKLQADLDKEAKEKGVETVKVAPVALAPVDNVTRTESGASSYMRKEWVGEIIDPAQVPREFCTPDPRLIKEAVKAGKREIPGVKISERSTTVIRG